MKNYDNMIFTDEQREILIKHKQSIISYIEMEIMPFS